VDVSTIIHRLRTCMEELCEFFEVVHFGGSHQEQAEAVLHIYNKTKPKNTSLKAEPLLVLEKVSHSCFLMCLKTLNLISEC